ncbi:FmdE family protein [uncultured Mailhella sp.]|uniref:FmdE family protein n=1 Tax=uncultured Mailhella sp. TaxID=1981031 RepID=UPI0025EDA6CE|nr:FmdE family protein [uncultured Mailhella sp.]
MYAPGITQELIDKAVAFHGHWCPGLSTGIRVAAWAMQNMGTAADEEVVAVTETDMCAVDAIQALVGCTFGKGNLIFRDRGKVAFSFFRRSDGKKARLVQKMHEDDLSRRAKEIRKELESENLSGDRRSSLEAEAEHLKRRRIEQILSLPFEELFAVGEPLCDMPHMARRLPTIICDECGEGVMSTRIREVNGRHLCMDCAEKAAGVQP